MCEVCTDFWCRPGPRTSTSQRRQHRRRWSRCCSDWWRGNYEGEEPEIHLRKGQEKICYLTDVPLMCHSLSISPTVGLLLLIILFLLLIFFYGACIAGCGASSALFPPLISLLPPAVSWWFGKRVMDVERRVAVVCNRKTVTSEHNNLFKESEDPQSSIISGFWGSFPGCVFLKVFEPLTSWPNHTRVG